MERNCGNCEHSQWHYVREEFYCQNQNSMWYGDVVDYDTHCMQWKGETYDSDGSRDNPRQG